MDVDLFLELFLIFVVAFSLWFCLRWRKRSRCGAAQRSKDEVAMTNYKAQTTSPVIPNELKTVLSADEGLSAAGCYGYATSYLSEALGQIGLSDREKDPDYIRGLSVYSMSAVSNIGKLATGAYANPTVKGWEERTKDNVLVRSLSWNWVNETAPNAVKIVLKGVEMQRQRNNPTLRFSISWSTKSSEDFTKATIQDPKTFYISKRTSSVMKQDVTHLCAKITYKTALSKTGTIEFPPKPFKEIDSPKEQTWASTDGSVVLDVILSTVEFSSVYPDPADKSATSESKCRWDTNIPVFNIVDWTTAVNLARLPDLDFETCVYIDNETTSAQCWIFRLLHSKTVAIAFRGTQTTPAYDCIVDSLRDINLFPMTYSFGSNDPCILRLNSEIDALRLQVHRGFFTGYLSVRDIVLETVYQMTERWNSDWSIVVTGHSLGASTAILCGTELANRTLKGKRPNVSSLLLAPVRVGETGFVQFYTKSIPNSYRVVNQVDYIGTVCMEWIYHHVPYEVHCLDHVNWNFTLPDSSHYEVEIKKNIENQIKKTWSSAEMRLPRTAFRIPPELLDHLPGSYLYCVWAIINHIRNLPPPPPPVHPTEDDPVEEP